MQQLVGDWQGHGFNLIALPDPRSHANFYLHLNQTQETLQVDHELLGCTYLQKINDIFTGATLHIEPGIWTAQPTAAHSLEGAARTLVARRVSAPNGDSIVAQGTAEAFSGPPTLKTNASEYAFSCFSSFNSTPFPAAAPIVIHAPGSSAKVAGPGFPQYDLSLPPAKRNPYSPQIGPPLPATINGIPLQSVVNDPITLLQQVIMQQAAQGYTFRGTVINIATRKRIRFFKRPNSNASREAHVIGGGDNVSSQGSDPGIATVYATFWIQHVMHSDHPPFIQLQYAQTTVLNFPVLLPLHAIAPARPSLANFSWPHVSVATLTKSLS